MNLNELFELQAKLDERIEKEHPRGDEDEENRIIPR